MDTQKKSRPAIFLDRDGTIIDDRGHLAHPSQVVFFNDTVPSLIRLQKHFDLFIVTNQSGVARGLITLDDVSRVNAYVLKHLCDSGIRISETYVCPHVRSDNCDCIKPNPHFLNKAARDHGIDLPGSFVIGDHPHDVEFAKNGGATGIYVLSGHGERHLPELERKDTPVAAGILEAAEFIIDQMKSTAFG